ncbi:hypothetical protein FA13DRAFT_1814095 [Coprinellus micaceus]|uniref:F-box domain-containing protein n=1 Tax=Coprinellus micaceus TaxID=71717 RepID=A0A4Y7TBC4_COPMI|nr:hypothetical protein FA13DRAFT_1814095 [Coprinellus micaceus]
MDRLLGRFLEEFECGLREVSGEEQSDVAEGGEVLGEEFGSGSGHTFGERHKVGIVKESGTSGRREPEQPASRNESKAGAKKTRAQARGSKVAVKKIPQTQRTSGRAFNPGTPINRWGKELLVLIFAMVVDAGRTTAADYPNPEVTISHVCRNWRNVALSAPSLWTFFHFDGSAAECVPKDRLKAYLKRSKKLPLNLWLAVINDGPLPYYEQREVVELLIPTSTAFACDIEDMEAPLLQTFAFSGTTWLDNFDEKKILSNWSPNTFLGGSPSLKFVTLSCLGIAEYRPPLDAVVDLRLEADFCSDFSVRCNSDALDGILTLPHLRALSIRGAFFEIASIPNGTTVEAKSLEHFRCDQHTEGPNLVSVGEYFLSRIYGPRLMSLTLEDLTEIEEYQVCRYPSLETLHVQYPSYLGNLPLIKEVFSRAPAIRQLIWSGEDHHPTDPVPLFQALAESGRLCSVQEVAINAKLSDPDKIVDPLMSAFPKLSILRVREEYLDSLDVTPFTESALQVESLGSSTTRPRSSWGYAPDTWQYD